MRTRLLLLAAATSVLACSENNSTPNGALVVGTDSVVAVGFAGSFEQQQAMLWVVADSFDPIVRGVTVIDVDTAVANIAKNISAFFSPAGCISSSRSGNMITLRANECAGPMALNNTAGALTVTVDPLVNGVQITLSSSMLKTTTLDLTLDVTATYTANGNERLLTVQGMANGDMGQYTVSWMKGADCVNIDGAVASTAEASAQYTFTAFQVCTAGCPRSGTVTRVDPQTGASITTTYGGTRTVSFVKSNGQSGTATLDCQ